MRNTFHFVINAVLIAVAAYATYVGLAATGLMPVPASAQAGPIDWLFDLQIRFMAFLFALIFVPLLYSVVVFRRRSGDTAEGAHFEGNNPLEITWTVIPLAIVIWMGIIGADNLAQVRAIDPQAVDVKVVGYQWSWRFEYPQGFTSTTLYLPVNHQVLLKLESADVLHSFWVPEFRVKQDLLPGRVTELRITPTIKGDYKILCAEICGASHAYMGVDPVRYARVVSQEEYDAWIAEQVAIAQAEAEASAGKPDAGRGQKLYLESGCSACHSINGTVGRGPSWKGLYGSTVPLADGTTALGDDAYITQSIREPNALVHQGFAPNAMPNFSYLTDGQIADIIEFIKTLK